MSSKAQPLKDELKKSFFNFVEQRGFVREKSHNPYFTTFRRINGSDVHVFKIQWDKYWRPYFVINFGQGTTEEKEITMFGRLQRKQGGSLSCWFSLNKPILEKLLSTKWAYTPSEVVEELEASFEELENWWHKKQEGPHIYIWDHHA